MVGLCATFVPGVPFAWIVGVLLVGGFFRSLQYTSLNTIAYADIDPRYMSRATSLVAVSQQLSLSVSVALGASLVELTLHWRGARQDHRRRLPAGLDHRLADLGDDLLPVLAAAARRRRRGLAPPDRGKHRARPPPATRSRVNLRREIFPPDVRYLTSLSASYRQ